MIRNLQSLWRKLTAPRAAAALTEANAQLQQEIAERERAQARRQAALLRLSAELAATLEEAEVCRRVVDGLHDTLRYDFVAAYGPGRD
jgi:uncharacterized membrane protein YccC